MNKIKYCFTIPDAEVPGFSEACKRVTGEVPVWNHVLIDSDGHRFQLCDLHLAKYELLYLRLSVGGGKFLDVEAHVRAWEEERKQEQQSDTTQPQMA